MANKNPSIYPLIPDEAFLYQPEPADMLTPSGKQRLIFEGNVPFTHEELRRLNVFRDELAIQGKVLDQYWTEARRLKLLQSYGFDFEKTLEAMGHYMNWLRTQHPLQLTPQIQHFLSLGIIYAVGRDSKYRPIIIFDTKKAISSKIPPEEASEYLSFFYDFVVQNLMIEGQVENWVSIIDMGGVGITESMDSAKKVGTVLSARFHNRMGRCYILGASTTFSIAWAIAKKFLNEDTIKKISFTSKTTSKELFGDCNPSQVEQKFGGTMPNLTSYWPIQTQGGSFDIPGSANHLLKPSKYFQLYVSNKLTDRKINKRFIDKFQPSIPTHPPPHSKKQVLIQKKQHITYSYSHDASTGRAFMDLQKVSSGGMLETMPDSRLPSKLEGANSSKLQVSSNFVSQEGAINPVVHFQFNSSKPRTFRC